jgi:hypothetical protein
MTQHTPRLSSAQIWRQLERSSFAVVSHTTPAGEPRSSGVVYAAAGQRLYVVVASDSWKARHIAADGRVAVTVPVRRGRDPRPAGAHSAGQLGRQPRRRARPRAQGSPTARHRGQGSVRLRADLHVLPAQNLRALPQPVLRRLLPVRRAVQAGGGRHRAGRPGPLPRLADVRDRLPVQEGLLQPPHRQGREVHVLLPAYRGRHPDRLRGNLRRPAALPRSRPLRPRPGSRRRVHSG